MSSSIVTLSLDTRTMSGLAVEVDKSIGKVTGGDSLARRSDLVHHFVLFWILVYESLYMDTEKSKLSLNRKKQITTIVNVEIFVVTIFRGLNFHGVKCLWLRVAHRYYCS